SCQDLLCDRTQLRSERIRRLLSRNLRGQSQLPRTPRVSFAESGCGTRGSDRDRDRQSSRLRFCAPLLVCAPAFHPPLQSRDIQQCFPLPSNPRAARQSPPAPVEISDRQPTFFRDLCVQKRVTLSSLLFRRTPRFESCLGLFLRIALRSVAFSFADKRAGSGPVVSAFCH